MLTIAAIISNAIVVNCVVNKYINIDEIIKISDTCYIIPTISMANLIYTIYVQCVVYNYYVGAFYILHFIISYIGAFCKHQVFLHKHFNLSFPNAPPISINEKYIFG